VEQRVRRNFEAERVDGRGRRVLLGLFAAYHSDPRLLEPHVLLRYKEIAGVRYLRDLPRAEVEGEIARRYRRDPRFVRVLADYLSGMTDPYAVAEHARLLEMGAVPIPSVEQLRREEDCSRFLRTTSNLASPAAMDYGTGRGRNGRLSPGELP